MLVAGTWAALHQFISDYSHLLFLLFYSWKSVYWRQPMSSTRNVLLRGRKFCFLEFSNNRGKGNARKGVSQPSAGSAGFRLSVEEAWGMPICSSSTIALRDPLDCTHSHLMAGISRCCFREGSSVGEGWALGGHALQHSPALLQISWVREGAFGAGNTRSMPTTSWGPSQYLTPASFQHWKWLGNTLCQQSLFPFAFSTRTKPLQTQLHHECRWMTCSSRSLWYPTLGSFFWDG